MSSGSGCKREWLLAVEQNQRLVFAVNGERFELSTVDPSTTLLQFLRSQTRFKSVELGCGEGLVCNLFH
ncbi:hypothetical protein L6452_01777 [Arctium lappa]|uniref:Uncharacterized protein n=1 Tax=Arctium lappa TaxID=4217 RepID=A0ACB9FIW4_ARCLA|nr:hypothetical protein L6452_01777 [Arctium lappa]